MADNWFVQLHSCRLTILHQDGQDLSELINMISELQKNIALNIMTNKLSVISNLIEYDWLNMSYVTFKLRSKELFLNTVAT